MNARLLTWAVIALAVTSVLFAGLWLQEREMRRVYSDARATTEAVRRLGPGFENVEISVSSHPRVNVLGEVGTQEEIERLKNAIGNLYLDGKQGLFFEVDIRATTTDH